VGKRAYNDISEPVIHSFVIVYSVAIQISWHFKAMKERPFSSPYTVLGG